MSFLIERKMQKVDPPILKFTVMTFNVLADVNATAEAFPATDPACLAWKRRSAHIMVEILTNSPDIVCLQEVDKFDEFFQPELGRHGYEGIYARKPSGREGVAIFYKSQILGLHSSTVLKSLTEGNAPSEQEDFGMAGLSACLYFLSQTHLCLRLVCAHLKSKEPFDRERIAQAGYIAREIKNSFMAKWPVIVAGDLNATPGTAPLRELEQAGLLSAYPLMTEGAFTTIKHRGGVTTQRISDYIFHSPALQVTGLLKIPSLVQLRCDHQETDGMSVPCPGLPSKMYPSDHLALMAEFTVS